MAEYTLQHTAVEVDNAVGKALSIEANPTMAGTEAALNGLQIGNTKYKVEAGSEIHTYTANTTITQSGQPELYNQLKDDIANYRAIKIGSIICYYQKPSGQTHHYISQDVDTGNSINHVYLYSITEYTTSYQISVMTELWIRPTQANPTLSGVENNLDSILIGDSKYKLGYLPLSGGTMTGALTTNGYINANADIRLANNKAIRNADNGYLMISSNGASTYVGDASSSASKLIFLQQAGVKVRHGSTEYDVLDANGGVLIGTLMLNNQVAKIVDNSNKNVVNANNSTLNIGDTTTDAVIYTGNWDVRHIKNNASYNMLDSGNTSANPGNTTATLTSLKLNGTNYAIAGGTQVTFVDWS